MVPIDDRRCQHLSLKVARNADNVLTRVRQVCHRPCLILDTNVRVTHGHVDVGMPCEFLRFRQRGTNATNTLKQTRGRWLDLFCDYNARIEIVYIEPPFETVLRQNKARSMAVPESVIRKPADKCEPPTWTECHTLTVSDGHHGAQ